MRIGVIGASGFIGSAVVDALERHGHDVRLIGRHTQPLHDRFPGRDIRRLPPMSPPRDQNAAPIPSKDWRDLLDDLDGVVCAAGVLCGPELEQAHHHLPRTLAAQAKAVGVRRLIHISALGAEETAPTAFLRSKALGDAALLDDRLDGWTVLRPSLVYGPNGASAAFFSALASLPVRPRVGGGFVRPIHVDDVANAVLACLERPHPLPPIIPLVGPDRVSLDGYIDALGNWLGQRPLASAPCPRWILGGLAAIGGKCGSPFINPDSLAMMRQGADADPTLLRNTTGASPRSLPEGLARNTASIADRTAASMFWLLPLLSATLSILWIGTGLTSLWSYRIGMDLLAASNLTGTAAQTLLIGGAVWDMLLGVAMIPRRWRTGATILQALTILLYTGLASLLTPDAWLHPFGPLLKNIPLIAATLVVAALSRWRAPWTAISG